MSDFEGIEAYVVNEYQFELREEYEKRLKKLEQLRTKYQKCI